MPRDGKIYTILVSCPSDIKEEVQIVKDIISDWNDIKGYYKNSYLRFVHWNKNTYPEYGERPQAILNDQIVTSADIIVGIFWSRFGTKTGVADSGTEEEIKLCIELEKDIMVYFSNAPIPRNLIDSSELSKIENFKKEYQDKGIYWTYENSAQFREAFRNHLDQLMEVIMRRVPNAMYSEIIYNLKNLSVICNACQKYIMNEIDCKNLGNTISIYKNNKQSFAQEFYSSKSYFKPETSEEKSYFAPIENRDSIKYIFEEIEEAYNYTNELEKFLKIGNNDFVNTYLVHTKLSMIEILSWFVLTKPRKKYILEIKNIFINCLAFTANNEIDKLSFISGEIGWRANREYRGELYSLKAYKAAEDALYVKNKFEKMDINN